MREEIYELLDESTSKNITNTVFKIMCKFQEICNNWIGNMTFASLCSLLSTACKIRIPSKEIHIAISLSENKICADYTDYISRCPLAESRNRVN